MRLLLLLLFISSVSYGQILPGFGFGQTKRVINTQVLYESLVDNEDAGHTRSGTWTQAEKSGPWLDTYEYSNTDGDYIEYTGTFRRIQWISELFPNHGIAAISIDGGIATNVDQYGPVEVAQQVLYDSYVATGGLLTNAVHTIRITVTGNQHGDATDDFIVHDAFNVFRTTAPAVPEPGPTNGLYVATTGDDANPCSFASPCLTGQRAANLAGPNDSIFFRAGTYRGTIVPPISGTSLEPITFTNYPGEEAIISGLNEVNTAWTVHSGNIYKTTITLPVSGYNTNLVNNTTILANQVFKDGVMMFEARYPKLSTPADLFDINVANKHITNMPQSSITHADLSGFSNLTGATISINGWFLVHSRNVTSHSGTTINFTTGPSDPKFRRSFFLTNHLNLLTAAKEWHYQSGTLYFWQSGGGTPTGTIEYKARNWGFDLRNKDYIHITGLKFIGCEPMMGDEATDYIVLDSINATYTNHNVRHDVGVWQGYGMAKQMGIKLNGTGNILRNSEISYSASTGVWLGTNSRVEDSYIHHIGYDQMMGSGVDLWGDNSSGQKVLRTTIRTVSRTCIAGGYAWWQDVAGTANNYGHDNVEIAYNNLSDYGRLNVDVGAWYSWGSQRFNGFNMHHNYIHDFAQTAQAALPSPPTGNGFDGICVGVYFDQASGATAPNNADIHHNVMWNNGHANMYHEVGSHYWSAGRKLRIMNNVLEDTPDSYRTYVTSPLDYFRNNIFGGSIVVSYTSPTAPDNANAVLSNVNPVYVGGYTTPDGRRFGIQTTSPAKNAGISIPGITTDAVGTPDIGAYEFGASTIWKAGCAWCPL